MAANTGILKIELQMEDNASAEVEKFSRFVEKRFHEIQENTGKTGDTIHELNRTWTKELEDISSVQESAAKKVVEDFHRVQDAVVASGEKMKENQTIPALSEEYVTEHNQSVIQMMQMEQKWFSSFKTGVANNLTDSLFSFIEGTKSAEKAFGDFASKTLKMIAEMILRQTILNAVMSSFGGGASVAGTVTSSAVNMHAMGGWINEPVVGIGQKTGQTHVFGESGPEKIVPAGTQNSPREEATVLNVIVKNEEEAARQIAEGQSRGAVVNVIWQELPEIMRNMNRMQ